MDKFLVEGNILNDVNIKVKKGEITALVGPDGAGKTTLLRMVCGLLPLGEGHHLQVVGYDVEKESQKVQNLISYLPQKFGLYEDLSVQENIDLYASLHGVPESVRRERIPHLLEMTDMMKFTSRLAGRLSGGMKQKLGLICTLVRSPELLILDEPSVGVDPLSRRELWEIITKLVKAENLTVLVSTAYLDEATRAQKLYMLEHATLMGSGRPEDLMNENWPKGLNGLNGATTVNKEKNQNKRHIDYNAKPDIVVRDLVRKFGDFTAVSHTSFEVYPGEIFGMLGPNGAGKTTTFRMLCGLLPATSGELHVGGVDVRKNRVLARAGVGYVAQKFSLYGNLTVYENLRFYAGAYGLKKDRLRERIQAVVEEFGLEEKMDVEADTLPLGFKQRLSMAAALMHEPKILFLDEPTSGIDPQARQVFWQQIARISAKGTTIIITTHFMEEAEYCDRFMIQDHGELLVLGTPKEIRTEMQMPDANMNEIFIAIVERGRQQDEKGGAGK